MAYNGQSKCWGLYNLILSLQEDKSTDVLPCHSSQVRASSHENHDETHASEGTGGGSCDLPGGMPHGKSESSQ